MTYNLKMNRVNPTTNHSIQQEWQSIFRSQFDIPLTITPLSFLALHTPLQSLTNSAIPYQKLSELAKAFDMTHQNIYTSYTPIYKQETYKIVKKNTLLSKCKHLTQNNNFPRANDNKAKIRKGLKGSSSCATRLMYPQLKTTGLDYEIIFQFIIQCVLNLKRVALVSPDPYSATGIHVTSQQNIS
jgi:hypothetical protein